MSCNKKIKLAESVGQKADQNVNNIDQLNYSNTRIKEVTKTFDFTTSVLNQINNSENGNATKIKLEHTEPNIKSSSNFVCKIIPAKEMYIKDEITFEDFKVQEDLSSINNHYQMSNGDIIVPKVEPENAAMDVKPSIDVLQLLLAGSIPNAETKSLEAIQIKDEITVEEAKVEQYSEVEKQNLKLKCELCNFRCNNRGTLWNHAKALHSEATVTRCLICYSKFRGTSQLEKHVEEAHQGLGNECHICLAHYKKGQWNEHKAQCLGRLLFHCISCGNSFVKKKGLLKHLDEHKVSEDRKELFITQSRIKEQFFSCEICEDDKTYRKGPYRKHAEEQHDGHYLRCPDCRKTFKDTGNRSNHMKKYCKVGPPREERLLCLDCEMTFKTTCSLQKHIKKYCRVGPARERFNAEKLECPECSKPCQNRASLEAHISRNHRKSPVQCSECQLQFTNAGLLRYHRITVHTEPSFCCTICSKKFHYQYKLREHTGIHHNPSDSSNESRKKKRLTVCCKLCDYRSRTAASLLEHTRMAHPDDNHQP